MIKGSLLVSIPIVKRFLVENFQSEKTYFFDSFPDPLEKPLDGSVWNLRMSKATDFNGFGPFQRLLINKKQKKTQAKQNSLSYRYTPDGRL